ncbi:MAG: PrpF domain-containing protein [Candidatus Omnitrophota bacterium]
MLKQVSYEDKKIPCSIIRGGTSKGIFILKQDLPENAQERNKIILSVFGSPDPRQIDGLGGADPLTSKLAIISLSPRDDVDIEYTFGQVAIEDNTIDYNAMCGNLAAGAAIYAVYHKYVSVSGKSAVVRMLNTNTNKFIISTVPLSNGLPATDGSFHIDGVPGTGPEIRLEFMQPGGMITGKLFPTGKVSEDLTCGKHHFRATIIDAGNVYAFVKAEDLGIDGGDVPQDLEKNIEFMSKLNKLKNRVTEMLSRRFHKTIIPKISIISEADNQNADIQARIFSNGRIHKAYAITGAINTGCLLCLNGTVADAFNIEIKKPLENITIVHPSGIIETKINYTMDNDKFTLISALISRTARLLMEGTVWGRQSCN